MTPNILWPSSLTSLICLIAHSAPILISPLYVPPIPCVIYSGLRVNFYVIIKSIVNINQNQNT